jgi:hypothetical protein
MRNLTAPACAFVALAALSACKSSTSSGTATATASPSTAPEPPATTTPSLARGDKAPDFSLQGSDGKTHTLAEHAGKEVVVVAWFPKAFTGG